MRGNAAIFHPEKPKTRTLSRPGLVGEGGFEPTKALPTDLQSAPIGHSGIPPYIALSMEPVDGLEPPTC